MKTVYRLLFYIGGVFLFLFAFWYTFPTDYVTAAYTGEAASSCFCAAGITCIFVGWKLRQEWQTFTQEALRAAKEEAEAAVRAEMEQLQQELSAARAYIAAQDRRHSA